MDFKEMNNTQLIEYINDMVFYDEIPYALDELANRNPNLAFAIGTDILINNKGDDFLQASVWSTCSIINYKRLFKCISKRTYLFGWSTLETILCFITNSNITDINREFIQLILKSYNNIRIEKQNEFSEMYEAFLRLIDNT